MPRTPQSPVKRQRRRRDRLGKALEYLRGHLDDGLHSPSWNPLPPLRERQLSALLRWTRQMTSRVTGARARTPPPSPISARLAMTLVLAAQRDLERLEAAAAAPSPRPGTRRSRIRGAASAPHAVSSRA